MPILMRDRRQSAGGASTRLEQDMRNADEVMVKPVTTYMEGAEHKNERSEPYPVPRWHGEELKANGFALILEKEAKPEPETREGPEDPAPASTTSRPVARRAGARG